MLQKTTRKKTTRTSLVLLGIIFLLMLGTAQWAFAPYHQPPPPPPSGGQAQENAPVVLSATLSLAQEVPAPAATTPTTAIGSAVFLFDPSNNTLRFAMAYSGLSGPVNLAHFHRAVAGEAGAVVQTVCGRPEPALLAACPTSASGFLEGAWTVPSELVTALLNGELYLNLHTQLNPAGEIRGQITRTKN